MSIKETLLKRAESCCELCKSTNNLTVYEVPASPELSSDSCVLLCNVCLPQVENHQPLDQNHMRCLNDSMWSSVVAVQVMAWRLLQRLSNELWAQDALEMLYLDDSALKWAKAGIEEEKEPTLDSNGAELQMGDNVVLVKDLVVKGAGFTAKRGTVVRGIALTDNPKHIEGKVNGTRIVLLTEFLKKS
ncbi:PhnA domain protein [Marinomonas agarivorans]|nr:PhnA domain protein [Marinomonas agarivorans]